MEKERRRLESNLTDFVEAAWPAFDPSPYQSTWAIDALCEHLQAVTEGQIRHLLINFPPRCAKTSVASICFPAWTWARRIKGEYLSGPQVRFLCGSYNHDLSLTNSNMTRRLILSPWYQKLWGDCFTFRMDQNTKTKFDTSAGGSRIASSVGGSLLGIGGDIVLIDDPHNTESAESEAERKQALTWWKELSTTRLNDPKRSPLIVIMQRLHEEDVSGTILASEWGAEWTHLMIPMEYNWRRHCVTALGWHDPRGLDNRGEPLIEISADGERLPRDDRAAYTLDEEREGSLMWPERFGHNEIARMKSELGSYMASGRLQQMPVPDKGAIFLREWWQPWNSDDGKFPVLDYIIASVDGAFTQDEENDPSALTIWGVFKDHAINRKRIILVHAWRKHLAFSGPRVDRFPGESNEGFRRRTMPGWGLVEWVADTCNRFQVDKLLIEAKASGISAAQELRNRYGQQEWAIQLVQVKGDKVARALSAQPTFSQGMVYAPVRDWSELVIDEMCVFPKGKHDDLTDSATQAINYLRTCGILETDEDVAAAEREPIMHRGNKMQALYPC